MNQHLAKAFDDYSNHNTNFAHLLDWHLCHGFVLCRPECFAIGFFTHSSDPIQPTQRHHADSLFVTYCAGEMPFVMREFDGDFEFIVFQRQFKNNPSIRVWDYQKTLNRIK
jgi:hypothetical protein